MKTVLAIFTTGLCLVASLAWAQMRPGMGRPMCSMMRYVMGRGVPATVPSVCGSGSQRTTLIAAPLTRHSILAQLDQATPPFIVAVQEQPPLDQGLHSYAAAHASDGKWLFIGGRLDGLHTILMGMRAFPPEFRNDKIWVVDPNASPPQVWRASLDGLPPELADALSASNMQSAQLGNTLYIIGGYGWTKGKRVFDYTLAAQVGSSQFIIGKARKIEARHTTFNYLTAVDVNGMIQAVISGSDLRPNLRYTRHEKLRVTGGGLVIMNDTFYLVFGQNIEGRYMMGRTGQYTQVVRKFELEDDGSTLSIKNFSEITDRACTVLGTPNEDCRGQFHRRDLHVVPALQDIGTPGIMVYGGVFTRRNGAYNFPIYIAGDTATLDQGFEQQMSQYEAAALLMFDATSKTMYTTLFGGISGAYCEGNGCSRQQDANLPFICDATIIARKYDSGSGQYRSKEWFVPRLLPAFLGTKAHFLPAPGVPRYASGIIKLEVLHGKTLVGYIVGGIKAEVRHPGMEMMQMMQSLGIDQSAPRLSDAQRAMISRMMQSKSSASKRILAVYVTPGVPTL